MANRYITLPNNRPHTQDEWKTAYVDIQKALVRFEQQIEREARKAGISSRDSAYTGNIGSAFMQHHLASLNLSSFHTAFRDALRPETLRSQADHTIIKVLRQNRIPTVVKDSAHSSFLETPIGAATLVIMRCVECLSHPRYSEDENVLSNLRRYWKNSVHLLAGTLQRIPSEDAWLEGFDGGDLSSEDRDMGNAEDGCEVLYGRAGFLYALLRIRKALDQAQTLKSYKELEKSQREEVETLAGDPSLGIVVDSIIKRGKLGARAYSRHVSFDGEEDGTLALPPLMWSWHGRRYLGGAHGVAGILQILLSCPRAIAEKHISEVLLTVEWLIGCQDPEGNWPTKAGDERDRSRRQQDKAHINELVQWCHGAPGPVILLSTVLRLHAEEQSYFKLDPTLRSQLITSTQRGADLIYTRGLLRKGLGLCHGVSGSVYALLSASNVLDSLFTPNPSHSYSDANISISTTTSSNSSTPYLKKAIHLAQLGTRVEVFVREGEMKVPDHPWSLYEGAAGMCCAWAEVLYRIGRGSRSGCGMPGYEDLM